MLTSSDKTLIQQNIIAQMKPPDHFDLRYIQNFLSSVHMKEKLCGIDYSVWGTVHHPRSCDKELVCLRPRQDTDDFSRWIGSRAIYWVFKLGGRWLKEDPRFGTVAVQHRSVFTFTMWLTTAIASALPAISIIILVNIESTSRRLAVVAGFNFIISVCLVLFSEARRTDVFAVTAA